MSNETEKELKVKEAVPDYNRLYTVEDYHSWDENFRAELYEGTLIVSETPTIKHQKISVKLVVKIYAYLDGKPCQVFHAPIGVRLSKNEESIFEPDIIIICDESKLDKRTCNGPPDMIIEI
ncbi:MAG: Uma2 family endonuclease, partial [Oscillospiraceae bacterium]|nr:Uma2 family endonuclease [Oscillospiraceae bacterium]